MKITRTVLFALLLSGALAGAASAATSVSAGLRIGPSGRATVDLGFFYDDLAAYGNWVERPQYGWVWTPRAMATTWRPYQSGHWAWTDEGWTWISDEPYGWATYHYGRWYDDPQYGWEWVPGNEYAPAWVSWQEGGDYIGWAPLPPAVEFRAGPLTVSLAPDAYIFVPERRFLEPHLVQYVAPRRDYDRIYRQTRSFTDYQVVNQRIVNRGVPVDRIQRVVGRPVPRYQIAEMDANQRHRGARIAQNRVEVFRPQVEKAQVAPPSQRPVARRAVIDASAVRANRGQRQAQAPPPVQPVQPARPNHQPRQAPAPVPNTQPDQNVNGRRQPGSQARQQRGVVDPLPPQPRPHGRAAQQPHEQPPAADQQPPRAARRQQREQQAPPPPEAQNRPHGQGQRQNHPQGNPQGQDQAKPHGNGNGRGHGHNKPQDDNRPPG